VRRLTYVLIWLAVTTTAVFVAAAAVGSVRDQVTDTPSAMVPTTTIATSLAGPATPKTEPGRETTPSIPTTSTTTTTTTLTASTTTVPDVSTTTTRPPAPTTTTTTAPPPTTTSPPPTEIRSYDLVGGSVTVEVGVNTVGLAGASPKAGFSMEVENSGPEKVEVEFKSDHHESQFSGEFKDGVFVPKIEEDSHDEDD